jgi:DNA-binding NarL/FixJ family response regulator
MTGFCVRPTRELAIEMRCARIPVKEIAYRLGVSVATVYQWTRGALKRHTPYPDHTRREAIRLRMQEGLTNAEIAEQLHVETSTLHYWMGATPRRLGGRPAHQMTLRDRARYLKECGYSVRQIAEEMRLPRSTVGEWVRGL